MRIKASPSTASYPTNRPTCIGARNTAPAQSNTSHTANTTHPCQAHGSPQPQPYRLAGNHTFFSFVCISLVSCRTIQLHGTNSVYVDTEAETRNRWRTPPPRPGVRRGAASAATPGQRRPIRRETNSRRWLTRRVGPPPRFFVAVTSPTIYSHNPQVARREQIRQRPPSRHSNTWE